MYTNFRENKFAEAAAFENFEIYKEVFSPTIPKDNSKKGKSHLKRNSKTSSKTSAQRVGRIKPRSRTKSKNLPQSNKYCGQSGSSSEKLHIEDVSSNDELCDTLSSGKMSESKYSKSFTSEKVEKVLYPSDKVLTKTKNNAGMKGSTKRGKSDPHGESSIIMYPSSRDQDKEIVVKKRDIQMQVPLDIGMNFVVPPYKPLKLKRSSNFGNILHNLRSSARRTSSAPKSGNKGMHAIGTLPSSDGEGNNFAFVEESQIAVASNGTGKDKNLIPLRMPQIGFVQDQPDSSISITDSDVSDTMLERAKKNVHEDGADTLSLGSQQLSVASRDLDAPGVVGVIGGSYILGASNNPARTTLEMENGLKTTAQDIKKLLKSKLKSNKGNMRIQNNIKKARAKSVSNSNNSWSDRQVGAKFSGGNDAIFLPSVGHAVNSRNTRSTNQYSFKTGAHGDLTPLSPRKAFQRKRHRGRNNIAINHVGARGRIFRNSNDLPNFSPVRSRPAFT